MCQEPASRLCNLSERCHVRKVASLLARPLNWFAALSILHATFGEYPFRNCLEKREG
jgi:hypothetical protein